MARLRGIVALTALILVLLLAAADAHASPPDVTRAAARATLTGKDIYIPYALDNDVAHTRKALNAAGLGVWYDEWTGHTDGGKHEAYERRTFYRLDGSIIAQQWYRAWWDRPYGLYWVYHDGPTTP